MLKADMEEAKTGVVDVVDVDEKAMEKLLEFVYSGKIEDMDDQLEMLLYAADKYEINGLVSEHMFIQVANCTLSDSSLQGCLESKGRNAQKCNMHLIAC